MTPTMISMGCSGASGPRFISRMFIRPVSLNDECENEAEQRKGRSLLWDKQVDRDFQRDAETARVPQGAYVYQTKPDPH